MPDPMQTGSVLGVSFFENILNSITSGGSVGEAASNWLRSNIDTLATLGKDTLRSFLGSLKSGSNVDLLHARIALINAMTWNEALQFQALSIHEMRTHANERFRMASLLDSLGDIGQRVVPILTSTILAAL